MTVTALRDRPDPELALALAEFERQFTYPLGPGRSFRISHGDDYPRFFRAIGDAAVFVATRGERVVGTLGTAVRPVLGPNGSTRPAAYLGDLKVSPEARGLTAHRLMRAAMDWLRPRAQVGFAVVMDGTRATPEAYTGRAGLPAFQPVAHVMVFRIACVPAPVWTGDLPFRSSEDAVTDCYNRLSRGRFASPGGTPTERSAMGPVWLASPDNSACGRLEDTRRAKRLIDDRGAEMVSAHLASFACTTPQAGAELIRAALRQAGAANYPALFVAVAEPDAADLAGELAPLEAVLAPATVFASGLPVGPAWNINSSEI